MGNPTIRPVSLYGRYGPPPTDSYAYAFGVDEHAIFDALEQVLHEDVIGIPGVQAFGPYPDGADWDCTVQVGGATPTVLAAVEQRLIAIVWRVTAPHIPEDQWDDARAELVSEFADVGLHYGEGLDWAFVLVSGAHRGQRGGSIRVVGYNPFHTR